MSAVVAAAVTMALTLNSTTVESVTVTVTAAAPYDPCATTQLVTTRAKGHVRHKPAHRAVRRRATSIAVHHRVKRHGARHKAAHITRARQTFGISPIAAGAFDFSHWLPASAPGFASVGTPVEEDTVGQTPGASDVSTEPFTFAPQPPFDDDPLIGSGPGPAGGPGGGSGPGPGGGGQPPPTASAPEPATWVPAAGLRSARLRAQAARGPCPRAASHPLNAASH